jgi:hypothetical protein
MFELASESTDRPSDDINTNILIPEDTKENRDCEGVQCHCTTLHGRIRYTGSLFTFHLRIQKLDNRMQKFGTVRCDIISKPLVEVEILSP